MPKQPILISSVLVAAAVFAGCGWTTNRAAEVDLLSVLPAERRSAGDPTRAIRADVFVAADDGRMALVMEAPARATWDIRLPLHAQLQTALTGAGRVRIGASNGRMYLDVAQFEATRAWTPVTIDLRELSEVKLSLFYQPLRMDWRLTINADATSAGNTIALDRPRLTKS